MMGYNFKTWFNLYNVLEEEAKKEDRDQSAFNACYLDTVIDNLPILKEEYGIIPSQEFLNYCKKHGKNVYPR